MTKQEQFLQKYNRSTFCFLIWLVCKEKHEQLATESVARRGDYEFISHCVCSHVCLHTFARMFM